MTCPTTCRLAGWRATLRRGATLDESLQVCLAGTATALGRGSLDAVLAGTGDDAIEDVEVVVRSALGATADDVLAADGYLLGSTANFGYVSGALKHFFDSTFLQIGGSLSSTGAADESSGRTTGRPFGLYVHGRYDTSGAVRSVLSIVAALGWTQGYDVLEVLGDVGSTDLSAAYDLGGTLAALVAVNQ